MRSQTNPSRKNSDHYQTIGKPVHRTDAREKVTGSALYVDDLYFPRMLYMKVLRAGVPHAEILSIDTEKAEKTPGVYKVVTGRSDSIDPDLVFGTCIFDQPPIAIDKVRHAGEVVAAVVAETEEAAIEATKLIQVEYKELPFVLETEAALLPNAPLIHEKNGEYQHAATFVPVPGSNIFFKYHLKKGEYNDPFKDANIIVEDEFEYPLMNHASIEPHGAICCWDSSEELHIWSSSQAPFVLREVLSDMFELPYNKISVHIPYLGGGFGGKSDYTIEPLLAVVARYLPGYHVKFVLTREEVFIGTVLGRGMKGRMKIGSKKDGTFVGIQAQLNFADGAYADTSCNVVLAAGHNCTGPYLFPNCDLKSNGIYTNTPPVGAYRGYGHPEGQFMIERLIEKLANKLGMDSSELRLKNFLRPGVTNSLGQTITEDNGNVTECFERVQTELFKESLPKKEDNDFFYGRGLAALMKSPVQATNASSCVFLKFNEDCSVNISVGGVEMGQGSRTVLAQIAAETLKLPVEQVRISDEIDTQWTPYEWQTVASMTTMRVGNAIVDACEKAIIKLKANAAEVLTCGLRELSYDGKSVGNEATRIPLKDLVKGYMYEDGHTVGDPVMATGTCVVRGVHFPDPETGGGECAYEWTFGVQGAEVRINKRTGEVKIIHFVTALDIGQVINPETARGQVMGGIMQGIGAALSEKIEFDQGRMTTTTLRKYKIPRFSAMPEKFTTIFVENPQPNGPYGARPMAEHPIIGTVPAILNAIQNATGKSFTKIPVTPEYLLEALLKEDLSK